MQCFELWVYMGAASICALGTSLCPRTCLLLPLPDCQIAIGEAIKHFPEENPCHLAAVISLESARHERRSAPVAIADISEQLLGFEATDDANNDGFLITFAPFLAQT